MTPKIYKSSTILLVLTIHLCFSNEVHSFVNPFHNYYKKSVSPRIACDGLQADQFDCASCMEIVMCDGSGGSTFFGNCAAPNACTTTGTGIAYCEPHNSTELCECNKPQLCDPYDSNLILICGSDGPADTIDCSATLGEVCFDGKCQPDVVDPVCGTDLNDGWNVLGPLCETGYYCSAGSTAPPNEITCADDEYFDPDAGSCAPLPVNSCEGCAGYCPDKLDCSYYYVCEQGIALTHQQCSGGACFDETTSICGDSSILCDPGATATCPETYVCDGLKEAPILGCGSNLVEGWNVLGPYCETGYYCSPGLTEPPADFKCGDGEYFDPDIANCATLPVNSCEGCTGYCPDKLDCSYYYVCDEGIALSHQQCPDGGCYDGDYESCPPFNVPCDPAATPTCPATYVCDGLRPTVGV